MHSEIVRTRGGRVVECICGGGKNVTSRILTSKVNDLYLDDSIVTRHVTPCQRGYRFKEGFFFGLETHTYGRDIVPEDNPIVKNGEIDPWSVKFVDPVRRGRVLSPYVTLNMVDSLRYSFKRIETKKKEEGCGVVHLPLELEYFDCLSFWDVLPYDAFGPPDEKDNVVLADGYGEDCDNPTEESHIPRFWVDGRFTGNRTYWKEIDDYQLSTMNA